MVDGEMFSQMTIIVRNLESLNFILGGAIRMDIHRERYPVAKSGKG